jgi:hypothetical protein
MKKCTIAGCEKKMFGHGLCNMHYSRLRRHKSLVKPPPNKPGRPRTSPEVRFWSMVEKEGHNGCWQWISSLRYSRYPHFCLGGRWGKTILAHRYSYELFFGKIPEGMQIDHLCRNKCCVNPSHMEVVTPRVNVLRGDTVVAKNAMKTHCLRGHPFDRENTGISHDGRYCKTCKKLLATIQRQKG